jgi:sec-independent protein translocase protein TatA
MVLGNLVGPDIAILVAVIALLFGGSQLPKLARSLGSASHEFKKGVEEGGDGAKGPAATVKVVTEPNPDSSATVTLTAEPETKAS